MLSKTAATPPSFVAQSKQQKKCKPSAAWQRTKTHLSAKQLHNKVWFGLFGMFAPFVQLLIKDLKYPQHKCLYPILFTREQMDFYQQAVCFPSLK